MQNWYILQSLLNSYTVAYNDARWANQIRYNQIIANWTDMLTTSQEQFVDETGEQNTHAGVFLGNLDTYMTEVEALVGQNQPTIDAAIAAIEPYLDSADDKFDIFEADYNTVLALLPDDYDIHAVLARGFLTDLGTTELARINEKFTASLATQNQQLVDRGLYSSAIATDLEARNTRDLNEEIASLNDRLNREKLQNQHTLYGQLTDMRKRTLDGKERVFALWVEILKIRLASMLQNAELKVRFTNNAVAELMGCKMARLNGLKDVHAENMRLMAYQLDERNKLLVGLYGFVERRDDIGPEFSELAKLCVGLGDSGGGWVSP